MASIRLHKRADMHIKYCPDWVAGKKKGRPRSSDDKRKKGITDHVMQAFRERLNDEGGQS